MIEFKEELLDDILEELKPLLTNNHEEVEIYQDKMILDPDFDKYKLLESVGILTIFTMRFDKKLVGYNVFFIQPHIHYPGTNFAACDVVYIDPEYRNSDTINFFTYSEEKLISKGVDVVTYHMKTNKKFESLMHILDMEHSEHVYAKYIG